MKNKEFESHLEKIQDWLIKYALANRINSDMVQQMMIVLLCTLVIRNGSVVQDVLDSIEDSIEIYFTKNGGINEHRNQS